jgi:hypothetical protein
MVEGSRTVGFVEAVGWGNITVTDITEGTNMPYGGNDWLALTQEPTLEPEIPICDPHHHF